MFIVKRTGNLRIRTLGLWGLIFFYFLAGVNHFVMPEFYFPLIPPSFRFVSTINWISGVLEIFFALGLCFSATRRFAAIGIVLLLIAFLPSHIYFIQIGACASDSLCVPGWVAWLRLVVIHPLLIYWAFLFTKRNNLP